MKSGHWPFVLMVVLPAVLSALGHAQLDKIVIPAGTPEDQALTAIANEQDTQKKLAMYQDFLQKFSANPAAVAYGNWQLSQTYQAAGDLQKALACGDKALVGSPRNLEILVSQASIAQQMKDDAKAFEYGIRGGELYNSLGKQAKPEGMSDSEFAQRIEDEKAADKNSDEFLETASFNAIVGETDAKKRMAYIERFTPTFPNSRFQEQVTSYAMMSLSDLNDTSRLIAYAEKTWRPIQTIWRPCSSWPVLTPMTPNPVVWPRPLPTRRRQSRRPKPMLPMPTAVAKSPLEWPTPPSATLT
jgi:tetratricopeptide (TPR) repeat protein